jgi:type IV secretion system protein VirB3
MESIRRDPLFIALTRPQMFAGITFGMFVANFVITAELFLIFRTLWVFVPALALHGIGVVICLRDPRIVELWMTRASSCGRVRNYGLWRCNSYRP